MVLNPCYCAVNVLLHIYKNAQRFDIKLTDRWYSKMSHLRKYDAYSICLFYITNGLELLFIYFVKKFSEHFFETA